MKKTNQKKKIGSSSMRKTYPTHIFLEEKLCDEMGLTISELHIEGIRRMWNTRQTFEQLQLEMI